MRRLTAWALIGGGVATALLASGLWWHMYRSLRQPMKVHGPEVIIVEPGAHMIGISRKLADRGWLEHPYYLAFEARLRKRARRIKTGEYAVQPGMTPLEFLDMLVAGRVIQYSLTLPEGWTFRQIMRAVTGNDRLVQTLRSHEPAHVMREIGYAGYFAEGRFYPDTYLFPAGTTDVEFLRRACRTMERVLMEEWEKRSTDLPYASPYEALVMASLIEKETAVAAERARIAGVFVRRLQQGIKLQTDPSVIYGMGDSFDGNIRRADLSLDSPYNTYLRQGLPPTPVASPGLESIRAALHPENGDTLYFVSRGDGGHEFSKTLEEHNRAVKKYQMNKSP